MVTLAMVLILTTFVQVQSKSVYDFHDGQCHYDSDCDFLGEEYCCAYSECNNEGYS